MPTRAATKRNNPEKDERQGPAPDPTQALSAAMTMFDDEFEKLNLHGKISAISGWIGRIPKNGWNKFNSYAYVLESDLVEYVRYWLAAARILVFPESFREHTVYTFDGVQTGSGKQRDILTDSIIVLRYVEVFGAVKRAVTVLKMRGSAHDRDIREYRIDGTGLHVGDPFRTVAGILSGNVVNLVSLDGLTASVAPSK